MARRLFPLACFLLFAVPSLAEVTRSEMLAIQCFGCHGYDGRGVGDMPDLTRNDADETREKLTDFGSGEHKATIMERIARGYTAEEIRLMGEYFAGLR